MSFLVHRVRAGAVPGSETIAGTALVQYTEGDSLLIGRGATARLRFDETTVALEHARLQQHPSEAGRLEVADLGSLTGTYVNGKRVERAIVGERDWIDIGRHRIIVHLEPPDGVVLYVQELAEERPAAAASEEPVAKVAAPKVDYLRAYGVGRLRLAHLSWLAVGLAAAAVALAAWRGRSDLLRPGPVSQSHASFADSCGKCHTPWRGVDDGRCTSCHAGPEHQQSAARPPGCVTCHVEHRFGPRLAEMPDSRCVDCHRAPLLKPGVAPRFARRVTDFAVDHPQFAIAGADGARLRLDTPQARRADPGTLVFDHALHLRPDLKSPLGPLQLDCQSCHVKVRDSGVVEPIVYEQHCQRCHRLDFDPREPEAPHERPEIVHAFLLRTYAERKGAAPPLPLPAQRRLLPRRRFEAAPPPVVRLDERVLGQVVTAELGLYRSTCQRCHGVNLDVVPPEVTPVAIPARWLPYARFSHRAHVTVQCLVCHAGAPASVTTADVLLPRIELCRNCHGPQPRGERRAAAGATTRCMSCHDYHDKTRAGEWRVTSGLESLPVDEEPSAPRD